jgi:hypothetical protein
VTEPTIICPNCRTEIKLTESQRSQKRRAFFEAQDEIDVKCEQLIADIEGKLQQRVSHIMLFRLRWLIQ